MGKMMQRAILVLVVFGLTASIIWCLVTILTSTP